jgi:multicomponent Na+:H+ antiporter subunit G
MSTAGIKSLLAILFILVTTPTSSHAIARAAHKAGIKLCKDTCSKYEEKGNS